MTNTKVQTTCTECGSDNFECSEFFVYEVGVEDDGTVVVFTSNPVATEGFENFQCADCETPLDTIDKTIEHAS